MAHRGCRNDLLCVRFRKRAVAIRDRVRPHWVEHWLRRKELKNGEVANAEREFKKRWEDAGWRRRCCPGKDVLKTIRRWLQEQYKITVSLTNILNHYEPSDEVKRLLGKLRAHIDKKAAS